MGCFILMINGSEVMNLIKTNLVQVQEDIQEIEHLLSFFNQTKGSIHNSMGLPSDMLGSRELNSATIFPKRPYLIDIDVTKLP